MAIGGMHPVAHKKHWHIPSEDARYPAGAIFKVEGDSAELWIQDYNVRVCCDVEVIKQPLRTDKKVMVRLDYIDHDSNVFAYIRKTALKEANRVR